LLSAKNVPGDAIGFLDVAKKLNIVLFEQAGVNPAILIYLAPVKKHTEAEL